MEPDPYALINDHNPLVQRGNRMIHSHVSDHGPEHFADLPLGGMHMNTTSLVGEIAQPDSLLLCHGKQVCLK